MQEKLEENHSQEPPVFSSPDTLAPNAPPIPLLGVLALQMQAAEFPWLRPCRPHIRQPGESGQGSLLCSQGDKAPAPPLPPRGRDRLLPILFFLMHSAWESGLLPESPFCGQQASRLSMPHHQSRIQPEFEGGHPFHSHHGLRALETEL